MAVTDVAKWPCPMTLFETNHSTGEVSLGRLLQALPCGSRDPGLTVPELVECIAVGGWPGNLNLTTKQSLRSVRDYLEEIRRVDIRRVDGTDRNPEKVGRLLRSKSRLRNSQKLYFVDPSLAVAALRADPDRLLADLNLLGFLFESLVIRDLRVYAQAADASVFQYRDNTGLEVDAIVEAANGQWAAFEIKLGASRIDEAATNLLRFTERVDTERTAKPAALAVITGTGYGYVRDDGVAVVPIGALGP